MRTIAIAGIIATMYVPRLWDGGWTGLSDREAVAMIGLLAMFTAIYCIIDYASRLFHYWFPK